MQQDRRPNAYPTHSRERLPNRYTRLRTCSPSASCIKRTSGPGAQRVTKIPRESTQRGPAWNDRRSGDQYEMRSDELTPFTANVQPGCLATLLRKCYSQLPSLCFLPSVSVTMAVTKNNCIFPAPPWSSVKKTPGLPRPYPSTSVSCSLRAFRACNESRNQWHLIPLEVMESLLSPLRLVLECVVPSTA